MRLTFSMIVTLICAFAACSNKGVNPTNENDPTGLKNVWWKVQSFESIYGDTITLVSEEGYSVFFADSSITSNPDSIYGTFNLRGKTDSLCRNIYYSTYRITGSDSIFVDPITTTKVACRSSYMQYLQALESAASFQVSNNVLTIYQAGGVRKLIFSKQ